MTTAPQAGAPQAGAPQAGAPQAGPAGRPRLAPRQQAALVLGVPVALALIVVNGFGFVSDIGAGHYPVRFSVPVSDGTLSMSLDGGNATIRATAAPASTAAIAVTGTLNYRLARPALRQHEGNLSIDCPLWALGNYTLNLAAAVPAATGVHLASDGGDLHVTGVSGVAQLYTEGGDLTVSGLSGDLVAKTAGGDLSASGLSGASVSISAQGGDIEGDDLASADVTVDSGGGDIALTFAQAPHSLTVQAAGGDVRIVVPSAGHYLAVISTEGGDATDSIVDASGPPYSYLTIDTGGGHLSLLQS